MSSHKTLIDGTSRTLSGGGCIINGTNYKISSGNTLIDGTSKKIEFEPPKTWKFNETIDYDLAVSLGANDRTDKEFFGNAFITPLHGGYYGTGNRYLNIRLRVSSYNHTTVMDYVRFYEWDQSYPFERVYHDGRSPAWLGNDSEIRVVTFDNIPTGDLLYFLQHAATPVY